MEGFTLGTPVVVCRWRVYDRKLPLENRHLRALGARQVESKVMSTALVAWAKQHLEWTLEDGTAEFPNGVLMLVVDNTGKAVMTVGDYRPLQRTTVNDLLARAQNAYQEAMTTKVSPEDLWVVSGERLVWGSSSEFQASGTSSLIADLARTLGMTVMRDDHLLAHMIEKGTRYDEVFLVSDEHGVVPASDRDGARSQRFAASYKKLLEKNTR